LGAGVAFIIIFFGIGVAFIIIFFAIGVGFMAFIGAMLFIGIGDEASATPVITAQAAKAARTVRIKRTLLSEDECL